MMDGGSRNEEVSPLIPKGKDQEARRSHNKYSEERKLELRLGPPSCEDWSLSEHIKNINRERDKSLVSLGYLTTQKISTSDNPGLLPSAASTCYHMHNQHQAKAKASSFLQLSPSPHNKSAMGKDASQPCCSKVVDVQNADNKAFSPASAKGSQKRTAPGPVVGWPPIRSFRKNLASGSSSKPPPESQQHQHVVPDKVAGKKPVDNCGKGLFVKINMDGVPIGRKVDINAYHSYENLSSAVDQLFRGLIANAAQRDSSACGDQSKQEEEKAITGLLDGSGEYALVYENNEGDRMLVGDVPWHMFVSTVKRLRVLKSCDVSAFSFGSKQDKMHHLTRQ